MGISNFFKNLFGKAKEATDLAAESTSKFAEEATEKAKHAGSDIAKDSTEGTQKKRITNELFADYRVSQRAIQSAFSLPVHTREKKLLDPWSTWLTHWSLYCLLF